MQKNYGRILKKFIEDKGLSQYRLAKKSGLVPSCISQLESNLRFYSLNSLIAIAKALEVTPNDLLNYSNDLVCTSDA